MARQDGIYVDNPKPDVYLGLTILTFVAMVIATVIMFMEHSKLTGV